MENTKICSKCGRELPLSEFNKCKCNKDGLQFWCKNCKKQHAKQYSKQYYTEHADERKQYSKQYNAEHADERKQYKKQWYAENRAEQIEKNKQWRADNSEYFKQYYATIEVYARHIRWNNLQADRKYGRCGKDEDPLPTIDEYIELLQQPDYYDGKQYPFNEMGLDRIDNSKPHTIDNVVPCSTKNNVRRQKMSFEEFCEVMKN